MVDTDFKKAVQGYSFEEAIQLSSRMTNDEIINELASLAYSFEPVISLMPIVFLSYTKFLKDDYSWNYILMRVIDVCYSGYEGMLNVQLDCANRVLTFNQDDKRALQTIVHLYERETSNCTEEEYQKAKAKMTELGITMYD